ncbi:hypothetical protein ACJJTC_001958 [Scirpophaga incertulas]
MAKSCNACEKPIQNTDYMICVKCKKFYDLLCLNIKKEDWKTIQSHRDKWLCPLCTNSRAIHVKVIILPLLYDLLSPALSKILPTKETSILQEKKLDDAHREIATLKCTVFQAQKDIEYQEQSALNNELEIIGIPEDKEEDLLTIISTTSKHLGVHLEVTDVNWVSRVGSVNTSKLKNVSEKRPRPIIVKLVRRLKRDEIIRASKLKRDFSTDGIVAGPCRPVFINERLTKKNRLLFREARIRTKRNNFKFCWYRNGFIYSRQKENEPAIRILSIEDLEKIGPEEVSCESA